ncbi:MAG TPA: hypothetical protein VI297_00850 [Gemmatimonadales bacterium]
MDRRQIQPLLTLAIALSLAPLERAEAQRRSAVATVQLTAVAPPGATFRPALGLAVNVAYRVEARRTGRSNLVLIGDGRAGLVPLEAVRDSVEAAGLGDEGLPVTVDLVLDAAL